VKTKQKPNKLTKLHKQINHHIKMVFIPHKGNQYRPHLIRRYGILTILLLIVGVQAGYNLAVTGSVLGAQISVTSDALLATTNAQRVAQHLPALNLNSQLSDAAYQKANDMLNQQYWDHVAPDGTSPWAWFSKVGYNYSYAGENLAKNFTTADAATTAWMASPEHRINILDSNYTDVGFAVVTGTLKGENTWLIVALYGKPAGAVAVDGAKTSAVTAAPMTAQPISVITRIGMSLQSLTPAALGSVVLLIAMASVAFTAHLYRDKLPKAINQSWRRHHGLIKAAGMVSLIVMLITLYSGGQI